MSKADYYVEKNEKELAKSRKTKPPVLKTMGIDILLFVLLFAIEIGIDILNVETDKPVLISADFSTIQYYSDEYVRIDELPSYNFFT